MICSICYTNLYIIKTDCNHNYCRKCIKKWVEYKQNCPICRRDIKKKDNIYKKLDTTVRITRSQTQNKREKNILHILKYYIENISNTTKLDNKIKILDYIFKILYNNSSLIRKNEDYLQLLRKHLYNLENNKKIDDNGYLEKIQIWKFKFFGN